jgi:imidazolonepropionase-like amidohydrolase
VAKEPFPQPSSSGSGIFATLQSHASDLALVGAKIYLSPSEPPIESGTILVHSGHILSVGPIAEIKVPRGATVIDCKGLVVTAGFWNSHVHILLPGLLHAENLSSEQITSQLQQMLTRWGFTTVFDIASVLQNTNLIRHRIESGEVKGPRILTVGEPFWMKGGTPIYVKDFLEANHISIPEVESRRKRRSECASRSATARMASRFLRIPWSDGILTMPQTWRR